MDLHQDPPTALCQGSILFAFWLISPFLFFNFVKAQRGIWRLSWAPPDSQHCITINYQARLCWELHLAWYKITACWQCDWLRVKPEWLNNIPIISVMRSPHSWNLANPVGITLTDQLGHEGPDSLRPQRGNSDVDDQMGIAAEVRSKGFEEKLWKAMLQKRCNAEFLACLDLTANVIHPPYVSHTSPVLTASGLKTIPAPQCFCYIPQSCLAHLRAETHVLCSDFVMRGGGTKD